MINDKDKIWAKKIETMAILLMINMGLLAADHDYVNVDEDDDVNN